METRELPTARPDTVRFKSYYVVWKLLTSSGCYFFYLGLNRTMQYGNPILSRKFFSHMPFKSYYVVWKQRSTRISNISRGRGLNRTMQYGNRTTVPDQTGVFAKFKSYYVVWKLQRKKFLRPRPDSLNRTMQYGNSVDKAFNLSALPV